MPRMPHHPTFMTRRRFLRMENRVSHFGDGARLAPWGAVMPADSSKGIPSPSQTPSAEWIALNRMAYGPRVGDVERMRRLGLARYVDEQLNPVDTDDTVCQTRLKSARLHIEFEKSKDSPALKEDRSLLNLNKFLGQLWKLTIEGSPMAYEERVRPAQEVQVAAWIRAVYSKWQLREVLVEFWHNHFNVNVDVDEKVAATWPIYDREVIRKNCFGNFRQFLEDVARSIAMQYYLNNVSSRASPANENYARELFELHTLGAGNYFNHLYNRWRNVPGATEGKPIGYIDQDVYEAARAFTGWTIADGTDSGRGEIFPNTGEFHYFEGWHDNYQKRVLGVEFDPNQPPMADGRKVLDLVANHPATAQYVCTKLCRRLVADDPPDALVKRAAQKWMETRDKPDQIKQTLRVILLSPEFSSTWGQKVKRPFELFVSFLRAIDADFMPNDNIFYTVTQMGYRMFRWPTPTGHPDVAHTWLSTNVMLGRWNTLLNLAADGMGTTTLEPHKVIPESQNTPQQIVNFWCERMLGNTSSQETRRTLVDYLRQDGKPDEPMDSKADDFADRVKYLVASIGMTPEFQRR